MRRFGGGRRPVAPTVSIGMTTASAPAFSNVSVTLIEPPGSNCPLEAEQHQVIGARLQHKDSAGLDFHSLRQGAHFHDAAFHVGFVQFDLVGNIGGSRGQAVGLVPLFSMVR